MTERWQDELDLPDEVKTSEVLAQYKTPEAALKGLVDTKSRLGRSIVIPDDDADETEMQEYVERLRKTAPNLVLHPDAAEGEHAQEFWRMIGVPEKPDEYTPPEDFDALPDDYVSNMREIAAKAGWTKKQFQTTLNELAQTFEAQQAAANEAQEQQRAIIDKKFGMAQENKIRAIKALVSKFADPEHPPSWVDSVADMSAADVLFLNNVVEAVVGKGSQSPSQPTGMDVLTPSEINEKLAAIDRRLVSEGHKMPSDQRKALLQKKTKYLEMRKGD